tara:strand:- start:88 stop:387 length:300 start_codon:yes stop_codon:yes gene_type:complete
MNIQKRLQIEFEFLGDEQISGNTALNIVNQIFEEAETEQLALCGVVVELPSKKSKEFERWTQSKGYEPAFNGLWYEKNNQTYNTDLLHRAFTNEIEFGN